MLAHNGTGVQALGSFGLPGLRFTGLLPPYLL